MVEIRLCRDCKHHMTAEHYCIFDMGECAKAIHLVTGEHMGLSPEAMRSEAADIPIFPCGKEGRFWEARDEGSEGA
jgi:hypothetical protein